MVRAAVAPPEARKADVLSADWIDRELGRYLQMLEAGEPFAHASYRDGEWRAMLGYGGTNVDGTEMTAELGDRLRESLKRADGIHAAFWPTEDVGASVRKAAVAWIEHERPDVRWLEDCPIRRANETGRAAPFFRALRELDVLVVGGPHLRDLSPDLLGTWQYMPVHDTRAWEDAGRVAYALPSVLDDLDADVVLLAAGMASELIIHELWPCVKGSGVSLIDVGAVLDPYAGVYSRGAYRDPEWRENVMPLNLPAR